MSIVTIVVALQLASATAQVSPSATETLLVGAWTCERNCPDEDLEFTREDGVRRYASWLHRRPAVVGAHWQLTGADLTVMKERAVLYEWRIIEVSKTRLVLRERREKGAKNDIVLRRIE